MKKINFFVEETVVLSKSENKQKQFGLLLIAVWLLVFYLKLKQNNLEVHFIEKWFYTIPLILVLFILVLPRIFQPILFIWFLIGKILGSITSFITLFVCYFVILLPIVFISNIFTKKENTNEGWITKKSIVDYKKLY